MHITCEGTRVVKQEMDGPAYNFVEEHCIWLGNIDDSYDMLPW